jgi:hypothetical protein
MNARSLRTAIRLLEPMASGSAVDCGRVKPLCPAREKQRSPGKFPQLLDFANKKHPKTASLGVLRRVATQTRLSMWPGSDVSGDLGEPPSRAYWRVD